MVCAPEIVSESNVKTFPTVSMNPWINVTAVSTDAAIPSIASCKAITPNPSSKRAPFPSPPSNNPAIASLTAVNPSVMGVKSTVENVANASFKFCNGPSIYGCSSANAV